MSESSITDIYCKVMALRQWMCDQGHKWLASFNGIKHAKTWYFLKTLEYPRGLELDIYYPQHGLAIEVQGIQHRQYRKRFHKNEEDFEKQLIRDHLKKELCDENWICLVLRRPKYSYSKASSRIRSY
ncbi:16882_t:CDS:2 [Cetraspora pellucida]|uniref:16882_t:CDS:1 n=1 Tax=Cetraspora pellucida TaxID=1433469 RepID=A0ACA9NYJ0_9GLOM|nr:16882_t:CDS:2 [Cetraspora pellucida]